MDDEQTETDSGRRISLPEPDIENITVLTKSLPNEPILPWHHYDSPWLEREDTPEGDTEPAADAADSTDPVAEETAAAAEDQAENSEVEQLALPLEAAIAETQSEDDVSVDEPSLNSVAVAETVAEAPPSEEQASNGTDR
jgi:hypothetical protein